MRAFCEESAGSAGVRIPFYNKFARERERGADQMIICSMGNYRWGFVYRCDRGLLSMAYF